MKFGIWIEPEMISEDSDLYREHPDWALTIPGRNPVRSRNQLVLDFSRKEVVDGIFGQISAVLDNANIEYVKWDMNRSLMDVFSVMTKDQGRVMYDYVLGLYDFLDRMVNRYPDLLIEGCSGGGGRFDAGVLYYTPQIWCSDNSDAIDRLRSSMALPSDIRYRPWEHVCLQYRTIRQEGSPRYIPEVWLPCPEPSATSWIF